MCAIHLQRHGHCAQGIDTCQQIRQLFSRQIVGSLTHAVQLHDITMYRAHHAVLDGHFSTRQADDIDGVALRIVVIVVALRSRNLHGVLAFYAEYGVAEGVLGLQGVFLALGPVVLLDGIGQRQLLLVASNVLEVVVLVAKEVELLKAYLLVVDDDRRMVDAVVLGMIVDDGLRHIHLLSVLPQTLDGV